MTPEKRSFHSHHSPIGALASRIKMISAAIEKINLPRIKGYTNRKTRVNIGLEACTKIFLFIVVLCFSYTSTAFSSTQVIPETEEEYRTRMQWFHDARFGLFIHFGIYSTLGGQWRGKNAQGYAEWIQAKANITPEEYIPLAANFNPDKFDADKWISDAKKAGMEYIVITTKHHDGFCLWDSEFTEYDTGEATKFDRDILAELSKACKKYGIKFGTYYSTIDWHHPSQRAQKSHQFTKIKNMEEKVEYVKYMKAQLKELIEKYDTEIMWFDGDWAHWWSMEDGIDLYNYLRKLKPTLIINNRVAKRHDFKKDFGTPENTTPGAALDHEWEACWTVNHSWGWKFSDQNWKSTKQLIQKQIDINAKGGKLLLNVGPKPDGTWPEGCIQRLYNMGEWNDIYQEAVYGSRFFFAWKQDWGRMVQIKNSTTDEGSLFAIVFDWPKINRIEVKGVSFHSAGCETYDGMSLKSSIEKDRLFISLPSTPLDENASVIRISYKGGIKEVVAANGLDLKGNELILQAKSSRLPQGNFKLENNSNIGYWSNPKDKAEWDVNIPAPNNYKVTLLYACPKETSGSDVRFEINGQSLISSVKATKNWEDYQLMDMGILKLHEVGNTTCSVGFGEKKKSALMNLKMVILTPME